MKEEANQSEIILYKTDDGRIKVDTIFQNETICSGYRSIPIDSGYFQRILYGDEHVTKALEIRKNGERPFNLIKKREGLETVRVRSQHGLIVRSAVTTIATLLLEMTGTRRKKKKEQMNFLDAVGF